MTPLIANEVRDMNKQEINQTTMNMCEYILKKIQNHGYHILLFDEK